MIFKKNTTHKPHSKEASIPEDDLAFMSNLSQAALEKPTVKSQLIVWIMFLVLIWLLVWANYAELDKIVRGQGKVVPSTKIQVVQNLEGGIVENIFVHSGDKVQKGQVLLKLDNTQFASSYDETEAQLYDLRAQAARLSAEAFNKPFEIRMPSGNPKVEAIFEREKQLYQNQLQQLETTQQILNEKITQNRSELQEAYNQFEQLSKSYELLQQEIEIMKPLVQEGIASEVDLLKTRREATDAYSQLQTTQNSIPRLKSIINESINKKQEAQQKFRNEAQQELNIVLAKLSQLESSKTALEDRVRRTSITSPVNGTISELLVTTIGEVIQPGSDIIKIVPLDDSLVLETKISPADIGFVYPGLKAKIKFTAYDFAIYGGLDGTVEKISADTILDEEGNSFYIARIKTDKNYLGSEKNPLSLLPGMTATVDVVVGKHTILDYLIKPIIKAKDLALRES
ncbi:HlyD family type I secretion periplasmic adaptor subunit [Hydrogenovibrio sp. 3SP14C1]|uniref:HlyD family type I secretion periplasmic adaptor subunit n=1 Tax=Hydrogenovibrio sp. 3SP14C1 TaxID=3038774 RepID=UPI00241625BC|nr:HlyD family type I secretion periplasmic adaptor subunit [Hydrogenovibrio sp. 3SP14C1]MDG4813221.1 HlyD family type I secretion periplasmic adaptor subunit [Hydrogenovibrio sp. 3SP14C1]